MWFASNSNRDAYIAPLLVWVQNVCTVGCLTLLNPLAVCVYETNRLGRVLLQRYLLLNLILSLMNYYFLKLKLHCTPGNIVFSFFFSSGYEWNKISEVLNCVLPLSVCVLLPGMCAVEVLVQRGHYVCWEITLAKRNAATLESFLYPVFSFVIF